MSPATHLTMEAAAVVGALGYLIRTVSRIWRRLESWEHFFTETSRTNDLVRHELTPNNGGSMKDALNRIAAIEAQVSDLRAYVRRREESENRP